jgi:hypothetical protein
LCQGKQSVKAEALQGIVNSKHSNLSWDRIDVIRRWLVAASVCLIAGSGSLLASGETNPAPRPQRGYTYIRDVISEVPWSIHVLRIDRQRSDLKLHSVAGHYPELGMATVPDQIKSLPASLGRPIAAINGDFYKNARNYPGDPEGLQIMEGELISGPNPTRVCFWVDCDGVPHRTNVIAQFQVIWPDGTAIPFGLNEERDGNAVLYTAANGKTTRTAGGVEITLEASGTGPWLPLQAGQTYTAKVRNVSSHGNSPLSKDTMVLSLNSDLAQHVPLVRVGSVLKISTATIPDLKGTKTAIGGGPTLVTDGKARTWTGSQPRHPRTAIGWNKDYIYLLVVDGRQRNISVGMTFPELADYMVKLGCEEAMNLDGGGSATFWIYGNVINSPSQGKERPAANALVLMQHEKEPAGK